MNFKVYVIHSAKPIPDLKEALDKSGGYTYVGIIYKSLHRKKDNVHITEKEETKKTIVFCPDSTISNLEKDYPVYNGKVAEYDWSSFPMPNQQQDEVWNLHISGVPNDYTVRDAENFVSQTLSCLLEMKGNYDVEFPPRLRETGEIYGYGHITFKDHVDRELIKLCKLVLHNTSISFKTNNKNKRMVACVWHRLGTSKAKSVTTEKYRRGNGTKVHKVDMTNIVIETIETVKTANQ